MASGVFPALRIKLKCLLLPGDSNLKTEVPSLATSPTMTACIQISVYANVLFLFSVSLPHPGTLPWLVNVDLSLTPAYPLSE